MHGCVFCQIVARESPVSIFYEDEIALGFMTSMLQSCLCLVRVICPVGTVHRSG